MIKTVKLILLSLLLVSIYSCNSSQTDDPNYVYGIFKNFTSRLEVSADTVPQGETVCVRLFIKNISNEKDSIANWQNHDMWGNNITNSIDITGEAADTFKCNEMRFSVSDCGGRIIKYIVFFPHEEKAFQRIYHHRALMCEDSSGIIKRVYNYIFPTTYKVRSRFYNYSNTEFIQASNNLQFVVKEDSDAVKDLTYLDNISYNYLDKIAAKVISEMDDYIEKYKNTVFEREFFLKKVHYFSVRSYPIDEKLLSEIKYYIDENPDSPTISSLLFYYKLGKYQQKDTLTVKQYLTDLTKKYKNRSAGFFAKEKLEENW